MILLIDGYNVLKKIKRTATISPNERSAFIKQINRYAQTRKLTIIIVFDGGPFTTLSREKISSATTVIYPGTGKSADDYIKDYLEQHAHTDLMLISSDRELRTTARTFSLFSLDSYEFLQFLKDMKSPENSNLPSGNNNKAYKTALTAHEELDLLMKQIVTPKAPKETLDAPRTKEKSLSKKEKKILQKLKKL